MSSTTDSFHRVQLMVRNEGTWKDSIPSPEDRAAVQEVVEFVLFLDEKLKTLAEERLAQAKQHHQTLDLIEKATQELLRKIYGRGSDG